jgi:hypothetical protein
MKYRFQKPCDVLKWGGTDLWDIFDASHILVGIEPSLDPNAYFEPKADALYRQLLVSIAMGYPKIVNQIGNRHLFLPLQILDWAIQKNHSIPEGLEDAIRNSAKKHIERFNIEKQVVQARAKINSDQAEAPPVSPPQPAPASEPVTPAARRAKLDISGERGARRRILEKWDDIEKEYGPSADGRQVLRVLKRDADETEVALKTVQNHLSALRTERLIP